ncbi:hypothetical protein QR680_009855 [Steinernema hermaphroditum]|uniref:4-nitrophenylphosphatase n=1 Tax=Steinernema hermaphroditum TaxID=289476 RepID=A0AA39IN80_9BILA|nr:hypothetical protein QR680_009855 [Steinernema hermaphroditum]
MQRKVGFELHSSKVSAWYLWIVVSSNVVIDGVTKPTMRRTDSTPSDMSSVKRAVRSSLLALYDTFIFDADGVLWLGGDAIPGSPEFVNQLVDAGKRVVIVTNNSTKTIDEYFEKTKKLGFKVEKESIVSPAVVTAHLLSESGNGRSHLPVYLLGTNGLAETLAKKGVQSFGVGPDHFESYTDTNFVMKVDTSRQIRAVVVSYDNHFSYIKLMKAINYLRDQDVDFVATNEDLTFPGPHKDVLVPGSGSIVNSVRMAAGRDPVVMGKPHRPIFDFICARFGIDPKRSLMVGDRCDTDILFGNNHGMDTMLVYTGIHNSEDLTRFESQGRTDLLPKYFAPSLNVLLSE